MSPRWIGFIVFIAIIMAILGAVSQGQDLTYTTDGVSTVDPDLDAIVKYTQTWQDFDWGTLVLPGTHTAYFSAMFNILVGQQNLEAVFPKASAWMWVWWILWLPIIATVVFGIIMLFISIIQRAIS